MNYPDDFINKIICGDCLEVMKGIPDKRVDLVIIDPPYSVGMTSNSKKTSFDDMNIIKPFFKELFLEIQRVMKINAEIYLFTDWRTYPFIYPIFIRYFLKRNCIVWDKDRPGPSPYYHFSHEFILYGARSMNIKKRFPGTERDVWRIQNFNPMSKERVGHPTQKPINVIQKIIKQSSDENDIILDPLLGSGTTALTCIDLKRNFIGIEINEKYCKIAEDRLRQGVL